MALARIPNVCRIVFSMRTVSVVFMCYNLWQLMKLGKLRWI